MEPAPSHRPYPLIALAAERLDPVLAIYRPGIASLAEWACGDADMPVVRDTATGLSIGLMARRAKLDQFTLLDGWSAVHWLAQFHRDDDWLLVDLDSLRLNPKQGSERKGYRVFNVSSLPVGILLAASPDVLAALPFPYQLAMQRRQSGAWEPYAGLPGALAQ